MQRFVALGSATTSSGRTKMQFVADGPEIPETLLQAHEDDRVVFFCGAGISYPAGLPGFKGLVDEIYRLVGTRPTPIERDAYRREQFDATLDLLERRLPGQRNAVRSALREVLVPNLRRKGASDTRAAFPPGSLGSSRLGTIAGSLTRDHREAPAISLAPRTKPGERFVTVRARR